MTVLTICKFYKTKESTLIYDINDAKIETEQFDVNKTERFDLLHVK